jgi:hypothetical protein
MACVMLCALQGKKNKASRTGRDLYSMYWSEEVQQREREDMNTCGLYIGGGICRKMSCFAAGVQSHFWTARKVRTGWRGGSDRVGVASHSRSASADRPLLPRDVGGDAVGVTSVWCQS